MSGKSFDEVLWLAWFDGLDYGTDGAGLTGDEEEDREAFQNWRRRFAGLEDAEAEGVGGFYAMGNESAQDAEGSETVSRSTSEICEASYSESPEVGVAEDQEVSQFRQIMGTREEVAFQNRWEKGMGI